MTDHNRDLGELDFRFEKQKKKHQTEICHFRESSINNSD